MSVKKLINSPEGCTDESLYGLSRSYPGLVLHEEGKIIFNWAPGKRGRIAILSGGGSGHEPFPSGYVGEGMLTASICGSIFTSPPNRKILDAIRRLSEHHEGVFLVIPNYTGDRLNFGLALETARRDGIQVESIVVGEDIALKTYGMESKSGRRGLCGLILVLKVAGYLSKAGENLDTITNVTKVVTENMAATGLSIEPCSLPGSGKLFQLNDDEMELGVGVHGEAGVMRMKMKSAEETVEILLKSLMEHLRVTENDAVVAVVNNLGTLSQMEQWIIAGEVEKQLTNKRVALLRLYVGTLFTSLNMSGVQICLLKLTPSFKLTLLKAFDDPTEAPAWPGSSLSVPKIISYTSVESKAAIPESVSGGVLTDTEAELVERCLIEGSKAVIANEEKINYLDSGCGDGDCGTTVARLAKAILQRIEEKRLTTSHPARLLLQLSEIADGAMGGTSGVIYGLFLTGASLEFSTHSTASDPNVWGKSWSAGKNFIEKYSLARVGDRTLLDALEPACDTFTNFLAKPEAGSALEAFAFAVDAAREGCSKTKYMKAEIGRASYTRSSELKEVDAGAFGITLWLTAFNKVLSTKQENSS